MSSGQKFELAVQRHREGQLEEAERLYREVAQENPTDSNVWYLLGILAAGRGEDAAAVHLLERAVELSPDNPAFLSNWGLTLRRLGRLEDASAVLLKALTLKPDLVEASFNLGLVLIDRGDPDAAIQCFERVADLKPELYANQRQLARALAQRGAVKRSVGHYHSALVLNPRATDVMFELAEALAKLGRKPAATALVRRAQALDGGA